MLPPPPPQSFLCAARSGSSCVARIGRSCVARSRRSCVDISRLLVAIVSAHLFGSSLLDIPLGVALSTPWRVAAGLAGGFLDVRPAGMFGAICSIDAISNLVGYLHPWPFVNLLAFLAYSGNMGILSFMLSKVFMLSSDALGKSTQELCWAAVTIAVDARGFEHSMVVTEISWICCHEIPHVDSQGQL